MRSGFEDADGTWVTELTEGASPWPRRFPSKQPRLRSVLNGRLPLEYVGRPAAVCATGIAVKLASAA